MNGKRTLHSTDDTTVGKAWFRPSSRAERSGRAPSTPHTQRFRAVQIALAGVAVLAVVVAVMLAAQGSSSQAPSAPWSSWSPPDQGTQGALEIAAHVAPAYRVTPTAQLSVVTVVNLQSQAAQAAEAAAAANGQSTKPSTGLQVAVKGSQSSSAVSLLNGSTIAYNLCGVGGSNCSIGVGTPSSARLLLLRREALELALYSLKYLKDAQYVLAMLPPGRAQIASQLTKSLPTSLSSGSAPLHLALLFDRQELDPMLRAPLAATLPEAVPPSVAAMPSSQEAELVSLVTGHGLFTERLQNAQDGSTVIVLTPLPPQ